MSSDWGVAIQGVSTVMMLAALWAYWRLFGAMKALPRRWNWRLVLGMIGFFAAGYLWIEIGLFSNGRHLGTLLSTILFFGALFVLLVLGLFRRTFDDLRRIISLQRATLESTTDGILVVDVHGRIVDYNRRFLEIWGIPMSIMETHDDRRALDFVMNQLVDPAVFRAKVQELYGHPERESEDVLPFKDGRTIKRCSRPQYLDSRIIGRVWSFRDATREEEVSRLKSEFVSTASHELRTPLAITQGYLDILLRADQMAIGESKRAEILQSVHKNTLRLGQIVEDLLNVSRMEEGRVDVRLQAFEIGPLIEEVAGALQVAAEKRGKSIVCRPSVLAVPRVCADPRHVAQVLTNLLDNALKYSVAGDTVEVDAAVSGAFARVTVVDHGSGILPEGVPHLFEKFHRLAGPATIRERGTGLGLYISKTLTDLQGGILLVCVSPGEGSAFSMTLPLAS